MLYLPTSAYAAQLFNPVNGIVTGAPLYFITGASFILWPASAPSVTFRFTLTDSVSGDIFTALISTATTQTGVMQVSTPPGFFYKSKTASSVLNLAMSTPITGGGLALNVYYGLTSV
jgi:hypothetical protein